MPSFAAPFALGFWFSSTTRKVTSEEPFDTKLTQEKRNIGLGMDDFGREKSRRKFQAEREKSWSETNEG